MTISRVLTVGQILVVLLLFEPGVFGEEQLAPQNKPKEGEYFNGFKDQEISLDLAGNLFSSNSLAPYDTGEIVRFGAVIHIPYRNNQGVNILLMGPNSLFGAGYFFRKPAFIGGIMTFNADIATINSNSSASNGATLVGPLVRLDFNQLRENDAKYLRVRGFGFSIYYIMIPGFSAYYNPTSGSMFGATISYSFAPFSKN